MRLSYVVWQEGELCSCGIALTGYGERRFRRKRARKKLPPESEELVGNGQAIQPQTENKPPRKWEVYEQILRILLCGF